jgi:DNA-binding transcriptional LysR family regulator
MVVLPEIQARLEAEAPGIGIEARPPDPKRVLDRLASGQVDLGIGYLLDPPKGLRTRLLFREASVCIARRGHPEFRNKLSLAQYQAADHLRISPGGAGHYAQMVEAALVDLRIRRSGELAVPNFLVAPAIVARSNLLATVPQRVAQTFAASLPLQVLEPPIPLPVLDVSLYWHERSHKDELHRWMRSLVIEAARSV